MYLLRSEIIVLDRPTIVEVTIREYSTSAVVGRNLGQHSRCARSRRPQRTHRQPARWPRYPLASSGWPLTVGEVMELKLANALLGLPEGARCLAPVFDVMPPAQL